MSYGRVNDTWAPVWERKAYLALAPAAEATWLALSILEEETTADMTMGWDQATREWSKVNCFVTKSSLVWICRSDLFKT